MDDGAVVMIDQTRLPVEEYVTCRTYEEVAAAIRDMVIRGAPAIGVAAAMGVALGVAHAAERDLDAQVETICDTLARTRPTAVNLFWAHRPHEAALRHAARPPARGDPPRAWWKKRCWCARRISPSAAPSAATARRWCRTARPC